MQTNRFARLLLMKIIIFEEQNPPKRPRTSESHQIWYSEAEFRLIHWRAKYHRDVKDEA